MELTDEEKAALCKLPIDKIIAIMHECAGILCCVSVDEYCEIKGEKRRTVYQKMKDGRLKNFKLMPFVNER